jgi:hypothetical protein
VRLSPVCLSAHRVTHHCLVVAVRVTFTGTTPLFGEMRNEDYPGFERIVLITRSNEKQEILRR